jgi:hypothetical protein
MKRSAILTMALAVPAAWAGEDIAGAKDHPLLTRYPDSFTPSTPRTTTPPNSRSAPARPA